MRQHSINCQWAFLYCTRYLTMQHYASTVYAVVVCLSHPGINFVNDITCWTHQGQLS